MSRYMFFGFVDYKTKLIYFGKMYIGLPLKERSYDIKKIV